MTGNWEVVHDEEAQRFRVDLGNATAVLDYYRQGNRMTITHTGVPRQWEGQGIAAGMTQAALEYARANDLSVVPLCSYASAYLRRHPEYSDLSTD